VAAGVLIDYENLSMRNRRALSELDDSKVRSPEEREELFPVCCGPPREWPSRSGASAASTPGAFT